VILLTTKSLDMIAANPNTGMLFTPNRRKCNPEPYALAGIPFAADNDCYNGGLDAPAWVKMLADLMGYDPLFVVCPDVVGSHALTLQEWDWWSGTIHACGFRAAFVLQDGILSWAEVPADADAVFVGGTDAFKFSQTSRCIVAKAKAHGRYVHIGRVNSLRRIADANAMGADSFDGSSVSKWWDVYAKRFATAASQPPQGMLA